MEMLHANIRSDDAELMNWWTERILIVRWKQSRIIFAAKGPFSSVACFKHHESCSCNPDFRLTAQNSTENQQRVNECTTVCFEGGKNTHCRTSASCSATLAILEISCSYRVPNDRRNEFLGGTLHWWMSEWVRHRKEIGRLGKKFLQTSSSSIRAGSISRLLTWSNDTPCYDRNQREACRLVRPKKKKYAHTLHITDQTQNLNVCFHVVWTTVKQIPHSQPSHQKQIQAETEEQDHGDELQHKIQSGDRGDRTRQKLPMQNSLQITEILP